MLFNSLQFLCFFPIVVFIYFLIPHKLKNYWLLLASYYFYMCWNAKYVVLILFTTIITYVSGLLLERVNQRVHSERRKGLLKQSIVSLSLLTNLSLLLYFKYFNFIINILANLLSRIHIQLHFQEFDILLPVGISFYTFQALSYTMDVYRKELPAEKNFFQYALFVSFFPQLVAGPIERSKNLLCQLTLPKKFDYKKAKEGLWLMLWGFFLKLVLADRIALFVDTVYGNYTDYAGGYLITATILFAVQIYCDFYGYSIIAIAAAKILGIDLMENFDAPYLSTSVAGFWRKWHISLTSWFKDYLYIPLGGSRKGRLRKYFNKLFVFLLSGLWHGASFSFVMWGGLNGFYQIIGEILQPVRNTATAILHLNRNSLAHKIIHVIGTFLLVDFAWIFFRASSFKVSLEIIKNMFSVHNPWIFFDGSIYNCGLDSKNFGLLLICLCILLFADYCKHKNIKIHEIIVQQDYWFQLLFMTFSIFFILTFGIWGPGYDETNFIYFQF